MNKILQQIDLTVEQYQAIETINREYQTKNVVLDLEIQAYSQVMNFPVASNASTAELRQRHQKIQALYKQLSDNRFEMMLRVRDVLTAEQRVQLAGLMEQIRHQQRTR